MKRSLVRCRLLERSWKVELPAKAPALLNWTAPSEPAAEPPVESVPQRRMPLPSVSIESQLVKSSTWRRVSDLRKLARRPPEIVEVAPEETVNLPEMRASERRESEEAPRLEAERLPEKVLVPEKEESRRPLKFKVARESKEEERFGIEEVALEEVMILPEERRSPPRVKEVVLRLRELMLPEKVLVPANEESIRPEVLMPEVKS